MFVNVYFTSFFDDIIIRTHFMFIILLARHGRERDKLLGGLISWDSLETGGKRAHLMF